MANPLRMFRRYQYAFLVAFGIMLMFAFIVAPPLSDYLQTRAGTGGGGDAVVVAWKGGDVREADFDQLRARHFLTTRFLESLLRRVEVIEDVAVQRRGEQVTLVKGRSYPWVGRGTNERDELVYQIVVAGEVVEVPQNATRPISPKADPIVPASSEEELLQRLVLAEKARQSGVVISEEAIQDYLDNLCDASPTFRPNYVTLLREATGGRLDWRQFQAQMATELAAQRMLIMSQGGLYAAPPELMFTCYNRLHRRVTAELLAVDVAGFVADVPDPSEQEIAALYEEAKDRFPFPLSPDPGFKRRQRIAFGFFQGVFEEFLEREIATLAPTITDAEIEKYYEDNKATEFRIPDLPDESSQPATEPQVAPTPEDAPDTEPQPEMPPTTEPQTPPTAEPQTPPTAEPQTPPTAEPQTPPTAEPQTPPTAEPQTPPTGEPPTPPPAEAEPTGGEPAGESGASDERDTPAEGDSPSGGQPPSDETLGGETPPADDSAAHGTPQATALRPSVTVVRFQAPDDVPPPQPDETPSEPAPAEPAPSEPAPSEPAPVEPAPSEPVPSEPAPVEPAPAQPAPVEPGPAPETPPVTDPATPAPQGDSPPVDMPSLEPAAQQPPAPELTVEEVEETGAPAAPPPRYRPLDDALRADIRTQLARRAARVPAQDALEKAAEAASSVVERYARQLSRAKLLEGTARPETLDLETVARENQLIYGSTPLLDVLDISAIQQADPAESDPPHYAFARATETLFSQQAGMVRRTLIDVGFEGDLAPFVTRRLIDGMVPQGGFPIPPEKLFAYWREEVVPEQVPTLAEVRDEVIRAWKLRQALPLARAEAERLALQAAESGQPLAEVFPDNADKVIVTRPFSWMTRGALPGSTAARPTLSEVEGTAGDQAVSVSGAGEDFMHAVFDLEVAQVGVAVNQSESFVYVVRVEAEEPSEAQRREAFFAAGLTPEVNYIMQMELSDILRDWYSSLEKEYEVTWKRPPVGNWNFE